MSAKDSRIKRAKEIEEWLSGAEKGHSANIIKVLLLIAEQNEKMLESFGEDS